MSVTMRETMNEAASQAMTETGEGTNRKERANRDGFNWGTAIAMGLFHVGAVAALFFFTWPAFFAAIFLWWVSGSLGIGMSYHRLLTHRGYKTPKWVEYFLTWCATLALEGGPIFWVATHRIHHQFSDDEGDPHSPIDGKWWAHMGLRPRPDQGQSSRLADQVSLHRKHYSGRDPVCDWRTTVAAMGSVRARGGRTACHLDGEFCHTPLGNAALRDQRPLHQ